MRPQRFYDALEVPSECYLGKRVFKKLFLKHGDLRPADKRALSRDVGNILWQYTLKPNTIPIQSYADAEREYLEIAILEVERANRKSAQRLGEVIHRSIPYPVVLVLADELGFSVSLAEKRFSRSQADVIIAEELTSTPWLDGDKLDLAESRFLETTSLRELPQTHFLAVYQGLLERVIALQCAEAGGAFRLDPERTIEERRADLACVRRLEQQVRETRSAIRSENNFARKVELNVRLKKLERDHKLHVERI